MRPNTENSSIVHIYFCLSSSYIVIDCVYIRPLTHTSEHGDGGGLASSIVPQECSDLTLIHVQVQFIHSSLSLLFLLLAHEQSPQRTL